MKSRMIAIVGAVAIAMAVPAVAFAGEVDALPQPGLTPASRFYLVETWMQRLNMSLTFGANARIQRAVHIAGEKLAEMEAMAVQNRSQNMEHAANQYQYYVNIAIRNMNQATRGDNATPERVATMMARHIAIMINNSDGGGGDCKQIRERARERAETCQDTALRALACQNPDQALRLGLSLMEQQRIRLQNCSQEEGRDQAGEDLRQCERLMAMNCEIMACVGQSCNRTQLQQMMQTSTDCQEQVMSQFRDQLQSRDQGSSESPLQTQTAEQQSAPGSDGDESLSPAGQFQGRTGSEEAGRYGPGLGDTQRQR